MAPPRTASRDVAPEESPPPDGKTVARPGDPRHDPRSLVRPELRALRAYHLDLSPCRHKLDQNEVPYELPPPVKRRIVERLLERSWATYPDFHSEGLRARLGERHRWPRDGVLVGNGSNELLALTLEALASPGDEVLIPVPSFGLYPVFCRRAGASPRFVGPAADARLPWDQLSDAVDHDPHRAVVLCSPNNPTGDALVPERLDDLLGRLRAPLLLDAAYAEFCRHDYRPLLERHRHLLIFRTFSKAWSLAGLRLGYLLADPDLVTELIKVKLPYNVGLAGGLAGEETLAARSAAERRIAAILGRRPQWQTLLEASGFVVWPSEANFLLARWPHEEPAVSALRQGLEARGIRVRDVSGYPGLAGCLRFSVGDGRALRATRQALSELIPKALS